MSYRERRERKIVRDLPDLTAARQEMTLSDFRDIVGYYNQQMFSLGLCDGHRCKHHKIVHGGGRSACYCRRARNARTPEEAAYWRRMHYNNCSAGRAMQDNLGCPGYELEGAPLYQQKMMGRKVA